MLSEREVQKAMHQELIDMVDAVIDRIYFILVEEGSFARENEMMQEGIKELKAFREEIRARTNAKIEELKRQKAEREKKWR